MPHPRHAAVVEELEGRNDADSSGMGRVDHRPAGGPDVCLVATRAALEVARLPDRDREECDRREPAVAEGIDGPAVDLPVGEVAVDLMRRVGLAVGATPDAWIRRAGVCRGRQGIEGKRAHGQDGGQRDERERARPSGWGGGHGCVPRKIDRSDVISGARSTWPDSPAWARPQG